jgi:hypothetical protein
MTKKFFLNMFYTHFLVTHFSSALAIQNAPKFEIFRIAEENFSKEQLTCRMWRHSTLVFQPNLWLRMPNRHKVTL